MLISWQCKKQTIVANSTTEAEYVVATNYYGQVLWIQNQMLDYEFNFMNTKIYIVNESTICIVKNLVFHSKTKHIEIRHHFIRDSHENKLIQLLLNGSHIRTVDNGEQEINATVDGKEFTITEASVRRHLQLANADEEGEGSGNPSEPQPPPSIAQPTHEESIPNIESSSPQKTQSPRKAQKAEAKRNKPMTQAQQRTYMCNYIKHMGSHTMQQLKRYTFDKLKHDKESVKKQKLEENDAKKEELRACLDIVPGDEIAMDFESLATKYPIIDWKTHILTENMIYYQIIRADGSSKNYKIFSEMLDDFDR
ncbi:hypothetical protein Tco_1253904 [Tanacetum coccineum]